MKGLPDSAVVGTYKRLHRKPKGKRMAHYRQEADILNDLVFKMLTMGKTKKTKR
jgi:hypothetical protein